MLLARGFGGVQLHICVQPAPGAPHEQNYDLGAPMSRITNWERPTSRITARSAPIPIVKFR